MRRRCACGCGKRCTVSEYWATDGCQRRWLAGRVEQLPLISRLISALRAWINTGVRAWLK